MSKSGSLKMKSLFRLKSLKKEDQGSSSDGDRVGTLPVSPGALSPGGESAIPDNDFPKEKKKRRILSLRRSKKHKRRDDGAEVFFPDTEELDSFSSNM